jgi:hypothetical protein
VSIENLPVKKDTLEEGDYLGQILTHGNFVYLVDYKPRNILVYKRNLVTLVKKHQLERQPQCLLLLADRSLLLIGEEDGMLEVSEITPKGTLDFIKQVQLPERNGGMRVSHLIRVD